MKRADRILQIEKCKRDVNGRLLTVLTGSRTTLRVIRRYPAIPIIVSGIVGGMITRRLLAKPLPPAIKLLALPLLRRVIRYALVSERKKA